MLSLRCFSFVSLCFAAVEALPSPTPSAWNSTAVGSSFNPLVTAPATCKPDCTLDIPEVVQYGWQAFTATENVTAYTIIYVVNNRTNTTRTITETATLPANYTLPPHNSAGTQTKVWTITYGTTSSLVTTLTYPTAFNDYENSYHWWGTLYTHSTSDSTSFCSTGDTTVTFPSHPPLPATLSATTSLTSGQDPFGVTYSPIVNFVTLLAHDMVSMFPGEAALTACSEWGVAPVANLNGVNFLTATSTSHEDVEPSSTAQASEPGTANTPSTNDAGATSTAAIESSVTDIGEPTTTTKPSTTNPGGVIISIINNPPTTTQPTAIEQTQPTATQTQGSGSNGGSGNGGSGNGGSGNGGSGNGGSGNGGSGNGGSGNGGSGNGGSGNGGSGNGGSGNGGSGNGGSGNGGSGNGGSGNGGSGNGGSGNGGSGNGGSGNGGSGNGGSGNGGSGNGGSSNGGSGNGGSGNGGSSNGGSGNGGSSNGGGSNGGSSGSGSTGGESQGGSGGGIVGTTITQAGGGTTPAIVVGGSQTLTNGQTFTFTGSNGQNTPVVATIEASVTALVAATGGSTIAVVGSGTALPVTQGPGSSGGSEPQTFTAGGQTLTASGGAVVVGGSTLTAGQTATISGTPVVVQTSAGSTQVVVGSSTVAVPSPTGSSGSSVSGPSVFTVNGETITSSNGAFVVGGQTITPGATATISGSGGSEVVEVTTNSAGQTVVVVGGSSTTVPGNVALSTGAGPALGSYITSGITGSAASTGIPEGVATSLRGWNGRLWAAFVAVWTGTLGVAVML